MHDLIRIATRELVTFLSMHLPTLGPQWWTTHVEERLSYSQQQRVRERGLTKLEQLDFAALLRIVDRNWFELAQTANLPREGREWTRELQNVRNRWAHASTEQEAVEDTYRDADTLARCLRMLDAGTESIAAVETVRSTALREMAAAGGVPAASPEPAPAPTTPVPERPVRNRADRDGTVEVRDHVLWTKHIRGDYALTATLDALSERSSIDLEVDGCRGTWQKMDDGRDGRPTPGIKPLGPARLHWHDLFQEKRGRTVTVTLASETHEAGMRRNEQRFEGAWARIQRTITPGDTIRNWSRHSGYRGNDFTIHGIGARFVEIDSPGAENIQHIPRTDFARVHEHWDAYNAGVFARSRLRDTTRFSTYVISILHHVLDNESE